MGRRLEHSQGLDALLSEWRLITVDRMNALDVERALRSAGIAPTEVTRIDEVSDGWECRVFRVVRPGVDDVALRLYTGDPSGGTLRAEVAAYLALTEVDYPAPRLSAVHTAIEPLGAPFILIDWLDGPVADSLGTTADAIELITDLFVRLHNITPNAALMTRHEVPIRTNADVLAARSAYLAASDLEGFHPALDWLTRRLRDLEPIPHSYVHMDFHPKNIILTQAGPMVFDWGSFALADPRADLAWTLLLASTYMGPDVAGGILSAYKRTRPEGLGDLEFFEVSAVWRRFATILSILEGDPPSDLRDEILEGVRLLEPAYRRLVGATGHPIPEVEHLF